MLAVVAVKELVGVNLLLAWGDFRNCYFSLSATTTLGSPTKALAELSLVSRAWHSLHKGMYIFSPPIMFVFSLLAVRKVKLAFCLQSLQMAVSFLIFSHLGMRAMMLGKAPLRKVPYRLEITTTLPLLAAISENSTMSVKNWPSSIPITSYSIH